MSNRPRLQSITSDALIGNESASFNSPSHSRPPRSPTSNRPRSPSYFGIASPVRAIDAPAISTPGELDPLLGPGRHAVKKPFYRARPLWLVPFAVTAALTRGMTLAPRVEVFTQLSCARIHHHHPFNHTISISNISTSNPVHSLYSSLDPLGPHLPPYYLTNGLAPSPNQYSNTISGSSLLPPSGDDSDPDDDPDNEDDPRRVPSARCLSDPAVQAGAARLQTTMTTTMGFLSALTTGWWGHFGERHGRTRVLAISTFGLFLTDLMFILVSTPSSPFSSHGHILLLLAPVIEGSLGGWSALSSSCSAYISDCTSSGSRATIFSRFTGVFFIGLSMGPTIGGWMIRNHIGAKAGEKTVTAVFYAAAFCSLINFLLVLFVFPESLSKDSREEAAAEHRREKLGDVKGKGRAMDVGPEETGDEHGSSAGSEQVATAVKGRPGIIRRFLSPLAVFLPVDITDASGVRKKKDWSLTYLALTLFLYHLSTGIYQLKYLYAVHVYGWGAEQLSYYISFLGGSRAICLLFILPMIISSFKPKPKAPKPKTQPITTTTTTLDPTPPKPKPTKALLASEIHFDLMLTKLSLAIDIISNVCVTLAPAPTYKVHGVSALAKAEHSTKESQALFVLGSSLSSMGSGAVPAVQSLALCIVQARALISGNADGEDGSAKGVGRLFGALAVLQAVGQMILGPMLFGLIYSGTVAQFPKAIFTVAVGILFVALACLFIVQNPIERNKVGKGKKRRIPVGEEERGRSRVSKDLFGGSSSHGHRYR